MNRQITILSSLIALALLVSLSLASEPAGAQERSANSRFASLDAGEINVRTGPGTRYPVEWVFVRKGVPVEIIAEYDLWRKIRDQEGDVGWIHRALLSAKRTSLVTARMANIYPEPGGAGSLPSMPPSAIAEQGVILTLNACAGAWCEVETGDHHGWILRGDIWGAYLREDFD